VVVFALRARGFDVEPIALCDAFDRWDVGWFRSIAEEGYHGDSFAFWPLFPFVGSLVARLTGWPFHRAGALVSAFALLTSGAALSLWTRGRPLGERLACAAVLAFFPTAFILLIAYSEACFLALSIFALWFYARDRLLGCGILGCAAALDRHAGFLLFAALLATELIKHRLPEWRSRLAPLLLVACGTLAFMALAAYRTGNPFAM